MTDKILLFDFDGTVIDNSEGIYNCIKYALDKMGVPILPESILRRFIGPSLFDSFYKYCEKDEKRAERFVELYRERYAPVGHLESVLYDGIYNTLEKLKADGYTLAVCSSKPLDFVRKIAVHLKVDNIFSAYFCPGFATHDSDKRSLIESAIKYYNADKDNILMIGDTIFDIKAANDAGVDSLGVKYGFSEPGELEKCGATMLCDTPTEIYERVKKWATETV